LEGILLREKNKEGFLPTVYGKDRKANQYGCR
jgi:hypothetical protein